MRNARTTRLDDSEDEHEPAASHSPTMKATESIARLNDGNDSASEGGMQGLQSQLAQIRERKKKPMGLKAASQKIAPRSSIRQWTGEDAAEDDDDDSLSGSLSKKTTTQLLSFGADDEEEVVFQVKKSSQSRKLMKQKKAEKKRLQETVKGSLNGSNSSEDDSPISQPALKSSQSNVIEPELDIKLNHSFPSRPKRSPQSWILSGRDAEAMHMEEEDDDDEEEENEAKDMPGEDKESQEDSIRSILTSGAIPDANAIYEAKKKRQKAREAGPASGSDRDFIPIDSARRSPRGDRNGGATGGRLVREGESDDEEGRISFTVEKENKKQGFRTTTNNGEEEEEDMADAWEEQQYRKVLKSGMISAQNQAYYTDQGFHMNSSKDLGRKLEDSKSVFSNLNVKTPVTYNLQGIKNNLKERLESLNEVHRRHQNDADKAIDSLVTSQAEIERLEVLIPQQEKQYQFFQELRTYLSNLIECFNEKIVNIKYLEEKYHASRRQVVNTIMDRRREDVRDQIIELSSKPAQLDESSDAERRRRAAEREGRRRRRHQQRLTSQAHLRVKFNEGMSSDDELSTSDQANLRTIRQDVENQARQVLADVVEEFSTIGGIKRMMEDWKRENEESYSDAYVSLCLPKIFSPLVRLQLLFWNPFAEQNEIEHMEWYKSLATYAYQEQETEESLTNDRDRKLLSLLVEKVVLPKLSSVIKCSYDPLSSTQTLRCCGILRRFIKDYPTLNGQSKQLRSCFTEVKDKLKAAVDHDVYIPIGYMKQVAENPSSPHAQFVNRQFWGCFKLMKNVLNWQEMLGDKVLADLAVNNLLNKYLLIGLGMNPDPIDAVAKARQIVSTLPSSWRELCIAREDLGRFAQFLVTLSAKPVGPDGVRSIVEMLKILNYETESDTIRRTRLV